VGTEGGDGKRGGDKKKSEVVNRDVEMWAVDVYEEGGRSVSQVNVMLSVFPLLLICKRTFDGLKYLELRCPSFSAQSCWSR
jgi:hypothetical protein